MGGDAHDGGQEYQEEDSLLQYGTDFLEVPFAVSSSDQNLCSDAEAETDHEDCHVVDSRNGRCSQFNLSDSSQKGCIGQSDHVFHHQTDQDRVGHTPYLSATRLHNRFQINYKNTSFFLMSSDFCFVDRPICGEVFGRFMEKSNFV